MELYINTFGGFDIIYEGQSLIKKFSRSYKLFKLLEYFITFRGRNLLPETIIDNLWQDNKSYDPKKVLRTSIFRLRQILKKISDSEIDDTEFFNISFNNGYYCFELGERAILDSEEFENYIAQGNSKKSTEINEAIDLYKKSIKLYKGSYLSENTYEAWLVPIRNHYNRLYLKTLFNLMDLFKEKEEYASIIELCEESIIIEPYEETLHIYLIEAMLKTGQIKNAMSHYQYTVSLLSKDMGINSSPALKNVYRKIKSYYDEKSESNIASIRKKLEESSNNGALLCDSDYFRLLYNIEKRKCLRDNLQSFISLITISCENKNEYNEKQLKRVLKAMPNVLEKSLRKGDVYSFWNDTQVLVMLHGAKEDGLRRIESRVRKEFFDIAKTANCEISIEFLPLANENNILQKPYQ